jgi:polyisoprenoid-binding protein YceI
MPRYRFDPKLSRFTVQAFAAGVLSFLGHSPTFAVRDFRGVLSFDGDTMKNLRLEMTVWADRLQLMDQVRAADRQEIESTMRRDVLESEVYREICYQAAAGEAETIAPGLYRLRIGGQLELHGSVRPQRLDTELLIFEDGIRLRGECRLRLSDYHIRPVTALGGTIKLKDELQVTFDLVGFREEA